MAGSVMMQEDEDDVVAEGLTVTFSVTLIL